MSNPEKVFPLQAETYVATRTSLADCHNFWAKTQMILILFLPINESKTHYCKWTWIYKFPVNNITAVFSSLRKNNIKDAKIKEERTVVFGCISYDYVWLAHFFVFKRWTRGPFKWFSHLVKEWALIWLLSLCQASIVDCSQVLAEMIMWTHKQVKWFCWD